MNGSPLIARCLRFIFGSRYAESTRSQFGVSASSTPILLAQIAAFVVELFQPWCLRFSPPGFSFESATGW